MSDDEISALFKNPHFQHCMFNFIQHHLQIKVDVDASSCRVNVGVELHGRDRGSRLSDYLLGASDGSTY